MTFFLDIFKHIKILPFLFAYVLFFFLDVFRAYKNIFFCLLSTKKALNSPNNLIYNTTNKDQQCKIFYSGSDFNFAINLVSDTNSNASIMHIFFWYFITQKVCFYYAVKFSYFGFYYAVKFSYFGFYVFFIIIWLTMKLNI